MRILLTGAAGFIGSNTAEQLLLEGHEVLGVDDLNDAYDPRLKRWRLEQLLPRKGFRFVAGDVRDKALVGGLFEQASPDAVIHLAARAGVRQSLADPWIYFETNVTGTLNVIDQARVHDVARVVLASTSSLYGASDQRPFSETTNTDRPLSPYAASKKGAEALLASYAHLYGMHTPVLRYFTVYGPAGRPDMSIFRFIRQIVEGERIVLYGDGSQERDFTFVTDIARGTVAATRREAGFELINLGSDRPARLIDVLHAIEARTGRRALVEHRPLHPADVRATWADISAARAKLGWEPRVSLEEGLASAVEWYLKNREWARTLDLGAM